MQNATMTGHAEPNIPGEPKMCVEPNMPLQPKMSSETTVPAKTRSSCCGCFRLKKGLKIEKANSAPVAGQTPPPPPPTIPPSNSVPPIIPGLPPHTYIPPIAVPPVPSPSQPVVVYSEERLLKVLKHRPPKENPVEPHRFDSAAKF